MTNTNKMWLVVGIVSTLSIISVLFGLLLGYLLSAPPKSEEPVNHILCTTEYKGYKIVQSFEMNGGDLKVLMRRSARSDVLCIPSNLHNK